MSAHSILPPSGAAAWRQCAMWVTMNRDYPQPDTPESLEGTAAHWVFEEMLAGQPVCEGLVAPNGTVVTEEMIEGGELVVETVAERMPNRKPYVEHRVAIHEIHEHCFGTPDIWDFDQHAMVLEVIDYKFGHRFVDEFENDQGIAYVAGILDFLAYGMCMGAGLLDQNITVNFTVIQPRCFYKGDSVRTWSFKASDIRAHVNVLKAAATRALAPNPTATTNSECINCSGRHVCPALQKAAYSDAEFAVQSTPVQLSPVAASLELKILERSLERLNSRVEGLRETVTAYARQGHVVPWHRIERTYGRQVWNVKPEEVVALGQMLEKDLSKTAVVTPKQALKFGIDEAVISAYSFTPMGSIKLVPNNPADARRVFGKI